LQRLLRAGSRALPAMMVRQGGSVVLLASVAGYLGLPNATICRPTRRPDQSGRTALRRAASARHRRLSGQSGLREDAADGTQRFRHARAANDGSGRSVDPVRLGARPLRDCVPVALHGCDTCSAEAAIPSTPEAAATFDEDS
jgi:NADP-dependent 3-hydroxy acid dehydrogenase YdfG